MLPDTWQVATYELAAIKLEELIQQKQDMSDAAISSRDEDCIDDAMADQLIAHVLRHSVDAINGHVARRKAAIAQRVDNK